MVNMENYEEYMLLYADKELNPEQEEALLDFVKKHPALEAELKAYVATRFTQDESLVFEHKDTLLKTEPKTRSIWIDKNWKMYGMAACRALLVTLFLLNRRPGENIDQMKAPVATTENTAAPVTEPTPVVQPEAGRRVEELHSTTPVNAVAVKTHKTPQKAATPPVSEPAEEKIIADVQRKHSEKVIPEPLPIANKPEPEPIAVVTPDNTDEAPAVTPAPSKTKGKFVAAVLAEKPAGLELLEEKVNETLVAAKDMTEQIKNTELNFRIGKKELFTVRL